MKQPGSELQIRIHGIDGSSGVFTQDDPALSECIIKESQRPDFFAHERLNIAGRSSLTTFAASKITRIDLTGEGISLWKPKAPFKAPDLIEISESDFLYSVEERDLKHVERKKQQHAPGQRFVGFLDVQMVGGHHLYLKVIGEALLPAERMQRINFYLTARSLSFRLSGGGIGVVNLANAVKLTAQPGPAEVPSEAWLANEFANQTITTTISRQTEVGNYYERLSQPR